MKRNPRELWINDPKFSQFDEKGVPTHEFKKEKDGAVVSKPISENFKNKLEKEWKEQNELYNKWLELQNNQEAK